MQPPRPPRRRRQRRRSRRSRRPRPRWGTCRSNVRSAATGGGGGAAAAGVCGRVRGMGAQASGRAAVAAAVGGGAAAAGTGGGEGVGAIWAGSFTVAASGVGAAAGEVVHGGRAICRVRDQVEELHPLSPHLLRQIEDQIRDERHACEQVEQCRCFRDPSVSNNGFELDARQITQEIGLIYTIMDREKASIQSLG